MTEKYLNLPQTMISDDLNKYFNKIVVFKNFYQNFLCVFGEYSFEYEYGKRKECDYDEYKDIMSNSIKKHPTKIIGVRQNLTDGYMYDFKQMCKDKLDDTDIKFIDDKLSDAIRIDLFGLHTYGGYYGFFRPDLTEVIHMLNTKISPEELGTIEKIYVTTEPYPDSKFTNCYDSVTDKHKGKTICYIVKCASDKRKISNDSDDCKFAEKLKI